MDAEQAGKRDRRDLGGQIHEGGVAPGAAVYAHGREPGPEAGGGDRLCWCSSGEHPPVIIGAADGGVPVAAARELADELVQGRGQLQGRGAQDQLSPARGEGDLVRGEACDAGQRLSVEQHEQAGHPVLDGVAVVVEQGADQCPPVVVFDLGDQVAAGALGYVQAAGVAARGGPGHEGAGVVAAACPAGEPGVDVALGAGCQARAVVSQPGDQPGRRPDLVLHVAGLLGGDVVPLGVPAEPPQVMPGGEAGDDAAFGGVVDLPGLVPGPPFEFGEALVAGGQDSPATRILRRWRVARLGR